MLPHQFKDKIVIVTGAGRGIGKAVALDFAGAGGKIVLVSRTKQELEDACQTIRLSGGQCMAIIADVSKEIDIKNVFSAALESFGTVDILINSAGHGSENKSIVDVATEEWDEILDTNLRSIFLFSREALKIMTKKNYGKIVNIASMAARKGSATFGVYAASKFGVVGLTESMAAEVKDLNININAVNPGMVETLTFRKRHPNYNKPDLMQPEDIARVVLFLSGEDARCIKGSVIDVSNGQNLN